MATLGKGGKPRLLGLAALLCLHRLAESITLAIHLEDVAMVAKPVEQGGGHPLALEHLPPFTERQIARHQDAPPLIAVGEDPEEQLDAASAHRHVAQLVADQQMSPVQPPEESVQRILLLFSLELADQTCCREEPYPQSGPTRCQAPPNCQMCLPSSVTSYKAAIELMFDPFTPCQLQDLGLGQPRHHAEVV